MVDIASIASVASSYSAKNSDSNTIEEPIDLVLLSLKEKVYVKCRHGRELRGKLVVNKITCFIDYRHTMNI